MNPPWWGIPVVLVVGTAVIAAGWWWDRRRNRRLSAGFVTPDELPRQAPAPAETDEETAALLASRGPEPTLPAGLVDPAFITHPGRGLAVARNPLVVVTDADLTTDALVRPMLEDAHASGRPLVLVAPAFEPALVGTLHANHVTGRVSCLPVELADPDLLARAASRCGTLVLSDADLHSGWWPAEVRGSCGAWIADADDSWILDAPPST